jgi:ribosomal protein S18 acetylase RimI-like enzyme
MTEFASHTPERLNPGGKVILLDRYDWLLVTDIWDKVGMLYPDTSPEVKRQFIGDLEPGSVLGYQIDSGLAGVVIAGVRNSGNALIQRLAVLEEHRNKGVATELLDAAETLLLERGIERAEVQIDPDDEELMRWYEKRRYGTVPDDKYIALGLMKPLTSMSTDDRFDANEIVIPGGMVGGAFNSIFQRHTYFSLSPHTGSQQYGLFIDDEFTKLEAALTTSNIQGLGGFKVSSDGWRADENRFYTPVTPWEEVGASDDDGNVTIRRWHSMEEHTEVKGHLQILRIQEEFSEIGGSVSSEYAGLTADGFYLMKHGVAIRGWPRVIPFEIQDGKVEMLDEPEKNKLLRKLVDSANNMNRTLAPDLDVVRPSDIYRGYQRRYNEQR